METKSQKTDKFKKWFSKIKSIECWAVKESGWALWLVAFILLSLFAYLWRGFIINDQWPKEQSEAYRLELQSKEPAFHKNQFDSVIESIEKNQNEKEDNSPSSKVFQLK